MARNSLKQHGGNLINPKSKLNWLYYFWEDLKYNKSSSEMMKQNRTKHQNANKTHNPKYVLQGFEQRKGLNVDYTQH